MHSKYTAATFSNLQILTGLLKTIVLISDITLSIQLRNNRLRSDFTVAVNGCVADLR